MKKVLFTVLILSCFTHLTAQYSVSSNKRYLLRDGKPFIWMGDTAWELFHRLNREQAEHYLKRRAEQQFTVIQAVVLAEFNGLHDPNPYGAVPFRNADPTQPNEAYFSHVDFIIDKAADLGLTMALLPTWGDKVWKAGWGTGPEIFNAGNARTYGRWLANRYKNRKNVIWILGGDRNPRNESDVKIWNQMAAGVLDAYKGQSRPVISFHPQPNQLGAAEWFGKENWLSFNMFQTGHCRDAAIYDKIHASYSSSPTRPVIDGEPIYEDHPVCFNAKDLGTSSAYDVRKSAYLDLFAGAFGHTYGCHDIWQFYSQDKPAVNSPHFYWQEALDLPGALQMKYVKRLIEAFPVAERMPDQSLVTENDLSAAERIQACRAEDYILVYTAAGKSFTVSTEKITGKSLKAYWYNPRNGELIKKGDIENSGERRFDPPSMGYGQDWVLILESAGTHYTASLQAAAK